MSQGAMLQNFNWQQLQNGSDIRGVALEGIVAEPVTLTPAIVRRIGQAFVQWLSQQTHQDPRSMTLALGRDSRLSGPVLLEAIAQGMTQMGCNVVDVGLASTPAMFMSTLSSGLQVDGAIMLTASHLPFNRNGCKFFTAVGGLGKADISAILTYAAAGEFSQAATPGQVRSDPFLETYAAGLVQLIREGVRHPQDWDRPLQGLHIVVDAGNGSGGFFVRHVLEPLGARTEGSQFLDPDGHFPHHSPNPEDPAAIATLCAAVTEQQADFGIIFDTDVDRAAAVDAQGREINRNRLIALIAAIVLREHPGSTVVTDSITSEGLTSFIEETLQGRHHRYKRGYKNVINEAQRLNEAGQECWLAIETSGHGALRENYFLDDGAYLVSKLLIELAQGQLTGQSLTALIEDLQEPAESQELRLKIQAADFQAYGNEVMERLTAFCAAQADWQVVPDNYEGVRIRCAAPQEAGWFLLRLSLHDPVLPLNIESNCAGGIDLICQRLRPFFQQFSALDLSAFEGTPQEA
ncbi:phosphomannomutase/phosphoglucomutase [Lyngbya confervoides]|uniref:Phosphomannomutase/phosphoglucomutase n=1 Tax=Lyngbya confervoides BDU141951 TaxID=1574623 RepID=A0ABD4T622_9CYAN|nr:phosphomannomutase/phosphoglucomutase [Lyngbya confervoides]MCM1983925.1 phosphomannomutase/phosphoglucomutase [Lyngbya confervoides BDU141951]